RVARLALGAPSSYLPHMVAAERFSQGKVGTACYSCTRSAETCSHRTSTASRQTLPRWLCPKCQAPHLGQIRHLERQVSCMKCTQPFIFRGWDPLRETVPIVKRA